MKLLLSGFIIFAALITSAPRVAQSQSTGCTSQQRKELVVTVVDKNGVVVDNLRADQLSLKAGNVNATIADVVFHNNDQPLDLVVLIDASVSQERVLPIAKASAQRLIKSVATAGRDRVAVVSFSHKPSKASDLTSDLAVAAAAIEQIKFEKPEGYIGGGMVVSATPPRRRDVPGSTSIWDAIQSTSQALFGGQVEKRRRAMILFSDGTDTASSKTLNAAIDEAIKLDMAVFSIGVADPIFSVSEKELKKLSEQTGGTASFPKKDDALEASITDVAKRLRANYVIGYCGDSKDKLQLEITDAELRKTEPVLAYRRFQSQ